jgi:TolA-binding protein
VGLGVSRPAQAQGTFEQAKDLFYSGKSGGIEEACEAFQQLDKAKPGDKQIQPFMNMSCNSVKGLRKQEEDLYNQGVQLFNQNQFDDARQKFEQSSKLTGLKNFHYHDKAQQYLKQIDSRQGEEQAFQDAVKFYNSGKYPDAQARFNTVAQGSGPHVAEARGYLAKISDALQKQNANQQVRQTFDDGVRLYKSGDSANAYLAFEKVAKAGGPNAAKAQDYIAKIEAKQKKDNAQQQNQVASNETPKPPPTKPNENPPTVSDQSLRAGLRAYFAGDFDSADRDLSDYLRQNGPKQALAYFFRGAAHSSRFFLSGEKESHEKELAVADFQSVKIHDQAFQPPNQYVPPKILALYSQTAGARTP